MLVCNVPFLLSLVFAATRSVRVTKYLAMSAVGVQIAIAVGMAYANVGDQRRIAEVNFVIALPLLVVAAWCWIIARRCVKSTSSDRQISG